VFKTHGIGLAAEQAAIQLRDNLCVIGWQTALHDQNYFICPDNKPFAAAAY
jgi:hypothetical protein